jgi:hypothetical protein
LPQQEMLAWWRSATDKEFFCACRFKRQIGFVVQNMQAGVPAGAPAATVGCCKDGKDLPQQEMLAWWRSATDKEFFCVCSFKRQIEFVVQNMRAGVPAEVLAATEGVGARVEAPAATGGAGAPAGVPVEAQP